MHREPSPCTTWLRAGPIDKIAPKREDDDREAGSFGATREQEEHGMKPGL